MGLPTKALLVVLIFGYLRNAESRNVPNLAIKTSDGDVDITRFQEATVVLNKIDGIFQTAKETVKVLSKAPPIIKKQRKVPEVDKTYNDAMAKSTQNLTDGREKIQRLLKALAKRVRSHVKSTVALAKIVADQPRPELINLMQRAGTADTEPIAILNFDPKNVVEETLKKNFRPRDYPSNLYGKKTSSYKKLHLAEKALNEALSKSEVDVKNVIKNLFAGLYASKSIQKELKSTAGYTENIDDDEEAAMVSFSLANQILGKTSGGSTDGSKIPPRRPNNNKDKPKKPVDDEEEEEEEEEVKEDKSSEKPIPTETTTKPSEEVKNPDATNLKPVESGVNPETPESEKKPESGENEQTPVKSDEVQTPEVENSEPKAEEKPETSENKVEPDTPQNELNPASTETEQNSNKPDEVKTPEAEINEPKAEEKQEPSESEVKPSESEKEPESAVNEKIPNNADEAQTSAAEKSEPKAEEKPESLENDVKPESQESEPKSENQESELKNETHESDQQKTDANASEPKPETGESEPNPGIAKDAENETSAPLNNEANQGPAEGQDAADSSPKDSESKTDETAESNSSNLTEDGEKQQEFPDASPTTPTIETETPPETNTAIPTGAAEKSNEDPESITGPITDGKDGIPESNTALEVIPEAESSDAPKSDAVSPTADSKSEEIPESSTAPSTENDSELNASPTTSPDNNNQAEVTQPTEKNTEDDAVPEAKIEGLNELNESAESKNVAPPADTNGAAEGSLAQNSEEVKSSSGDAENPKKEQDSKEEPAEQNNSDAQTPESEQASPSHNPREITTPAEKEVAPEVNKGNFPVESPIAEDSTAEAKTSPAPGTNLGEPNSDNNSNDAEPKSDGTDTDAVNPYAGQWGPNINPPADSKNSGYGSKPKAPRKKNRRLKIVIFMRGKRKFRSETPLDANGNELIHLRRTIEMNNNQPQKLASRSLNEPSGHSLKRAYEFPGVESYYEDMDSLGYRSTPDANEESKIPVIDSIGYRELSGVATGNPEDVARRLFSGVADQSHLTTRTLSGLGNYLGDSLQSVNPFTQNRRSYDPYSNYNQPPQVPQNQNWGTPNSYSPMPRSYNNPNPGFYGQQTPGYDPRSNGVNQPQFNQNPNLNPPSPGYNQRSNGVNQSQFNQNPNLNPQSPGAGTAQTSTSPYQQTGPHGAGGDYHVAVFQNDGLNGGKSGIVTAGIDAASNVAKATVHTVGAVGDAGLQLVGGALNTAEGGVSAIRNFLNY